MGERQVNIYEAKTHLSRLVDEVEAGGEIVIARNGRPAARLVPLDRRPIAHRPGSWTGRLWIGFDLDAVDDGTVTMFADGPGPGTTGPGTTGPGTTGPGTTGPGTTTARDERT